HDSAHAGTYSWFCWRPVIGVPTTADPTYADYNANGNTNWTGCLSGNGVLYANFAKVLWVDTSKDPYNTLKIDTITARPQFNLAPMPTWTGPKTSAGAQAVPVPTGGGSWKVIRSQVLAGNSATKQNVVEFRLYEGESTDNFNYDTTATGTAGGTAHSGFD